MEQKSCLKEFARYTFSNILGMIGLSCYILADTFFIAQGVGTDGLTALNLAIPVYSFIHGSGLMLGMGGATKYTVFKGQGFFDNLDRVFSNTVYLTVMMAAIFMAAGAFFSFPITALLGADEQVFEMTQTYLRMMLLFAPLFMMNDILNCFVRNDGNPKLSMMGMLLGSFANIVLDYIFIFPMKMGILGAVLATGCAPVIGMLILSGHWRSGKNRLHLRKMNLSSSLVGSVLALGIPSLITELASGIVMIAFNFIILEIQGNIGVAAYGIIANLSMVAVSIYTGVAQGMQPLTSEAYGREDRRAVKQIFGYALKTMLALSVVIYLLVFFFANPIAEVFNNEGNELLQQMAEEGLKLYFTAAPFMGFNIVAAMFFISVERPFSAQVISLLRGLFFIIPIAFFMAAFAGMVGVWLALPVTEGLVSLLGMFLYWRFLKKYV